MLSRWHQYGRTHPQDELLTRLMDETPLLALHAAAEDGAHRVSSLRRLVDRLVDIARQEPACRLASLLPWMESQERAPAGPMEKSCVRILSVHGAKGLEFPTVILPDLARGALGGERVGEGRPEVAWLLRERALAIRTAAARSAGWLHHEWEEGRHDTAENKRIFYVACTRAKERLIFPYSPPGTRPRVGAWIHFLLPWGYPEMGLSRTDTLPLASGIRHRFPETGAAAPLVETKSKQMDWPGAVQNTHRLARQAAARATAGFRRPSGIREDQEARLESDDKEVALPPKGGRVARCVGLAVHDALEAWDFRDIQTFRERIQAAVIKACRNEIVAPETVLGEADAVVKTMLASDIPRYLASREILGRELPMLFEDKGGQAWNGTLDLLYRDPDGQLVIADYKTDRDPEPERHRQQLEVYAKGIALAFPDEPPPAMELLYLRTGERFRIASGSSDRLEPGNPTGSA
jgi:ATP-dependent helicase/nuclease subunit A